MTRVKVCGMTRVEDVRLACRLGAWAVGFVLAPSPRRVSLARAKSLRRSVKKGVLSVGVFSNASRSEVVKAIAECRLDAVQLHGAVSPEDCRGYGVPVIKAVAPSRSVTALKRYPVKRFLVEPRRTLKGRFRRSKPSPARLKAAWGFARRIRRSAIIAGGLTPENVSEAVAAARPYAVDVSSGVESSAGRKAAGKLKDFFEAVR